MNLGEKYLELVDWVSNLAPGYDKLVHVNVGLAIWLTGILVLRSSSRSIWPVLLVALAETGNELFDWLHAIEWGWRETKADFVSTLFWPAVLMAASRLGSSSISAHGQREPESIAEDDGI